MNSNTPLEPGRRRAAAPRERARKAKAPLLAVIMLLALLATAVFILIRPGFLKVSLNDTGKTQIYLEGVLSGATALYKGETLYLPFDFVKEELDPKIVWDEQLDTVIITTAKNVFHFPVGLPEGLLNLQEYSFSYPVIREDDVLYVPADPLGDVYALEFLEDSEAQLVRIHDLEKPFQKGEVLQAGKLRKSPSFRSPYVAKVEKGEEVRIMREEDGWFWVETPGAMGYLNKGKAALASISTPKITQEHYPPWNPLGEPIILTWDYASRYSAGQAAAGNLEGVQVLAPTWFKLSVNGLVLNFADKQYVERAHQQGRKVWALFDNGFDPDLTQEFFADAELRIKAIKQILSYVDLYRLDGINIDFENMRLADQDNFVQFIRELAPLLHEKERTLSVDVTFLSTSENWSLCYDRKALSEAADYLMVMGYDEHGSSSKTAGSVSSLPWVENGLRRIIAEVPPEKLILGVPFYTRLWQEETDESGKTKLSSKALSMESAARWVKENGAQLILDKKTGQHYTELTKGKSKYRMWLEDEHSLLSRVELMKKYRLAGLAAWRHGFESEKIWPVLSAGARQIR